MTQQHLWKKHERKRFCGCPEVTPVTVSNTNDSVKRFRNLPHSNSHTLLPSSLSVSQIDRGNFCSSQTPALTFMKKRGDERSDQITDSLSTYWFLVTGCLVHPVLRWVSPSGTRVHLLPQIPPWHPRTSCWQCLSSLWSAEWRDGRSCLGVCQVWYSPS